MLNYPKIDPIAFHVGPFPVHWYGIMYLIGFAGGWGLAIFRARRSNGVWTEDQVSDFLFYIILGVVLGGRIGYMFLYDFPALLQNPLNLFKVWQGGMSFHGGCIGCAITLWWYAKRTGKSFLQVTDFASPLVTIGLGAGRIGNFINGELWGRVTNVPWAMVFPRGGDVPRHPSQLYEFFLEGVVLFVVLWWYSSKPRHRGRVSALFLILYSIFRFTVEFFRQPDIQMGYVDFGWMTQGQRLCIPMFLLGIGIWIWSKKQPLIGGYRG